MPDQYYHFYNRGANRQAVFFERDNYFYFLRGIKKYLVEQVEIIAYCLMPTHYHILARVREASNNQTSEYQTSEVLKTSEVSHAMQKLGISYTKAINKRFERVGALFQGQFQGIPIQEYNHLLSLCIYIHANPFKDGLVSTPEEWEFSNYSEWLNLRQGTLVDREFIQDHFASAEEYRLMVLDYINRLLKT